MKERVEHTLDASLDMLQCTIGCRSKEDTVVEENTLIGASAKCKASVDNDWSGNDILNSVFRTLYSFSRTLLLWHGKGSQSPVSCVCLESARIAPTLCYWE